jgi:hypothetical protein
LWSRASSARFATARSICRARFDLEDAVTVIVQPGTRAPDDVAVGHAGGDDGAPFTCMRISKPAPRHAAPSGLRASARRSTHPE